MIRLALSSEQLDAADKVADPGRTVVVVAGPGSGKTRVLTDRIVQAIGRGVSPDRILAVTFTRKAAEEMRRRVFDILAESGRRPRIPTITTIHAWAAELLRHHGSRIDLDPGFGLIDQIDTEAVRKMLRETGLAKNDAAYDELLRSANVLDYDALEKRAEYLLTVLGTRLYDEVLVDEMQDLSTKEYEILDLLREIGARLFAVGDPLQAVFTWRGSSLDGADAWGALGHTFDLVDNYRSAPVIVDFVDTLAGGSSVLRNRFVAKSTHAGRVDVGPIDPIRWLQDLDRAGDWGTVAVLGRTWRTLRSFGELLDEARIPNVVYSPSLYGWDTDWGRAVSYLFRLARLRAEGGSDTVLVQLLLHVVGQASALPHLRMLALRQRTHLTDVMAPIVSGFAATMFDWDLTLIQRVEMLLRYLGQPVEPCLRVLDARRWAENLEGWWGWFMFRDLQDRLVEGDHIHLLTPYGAKGLEWDHVVIPDASSRTYHLADGELRRVLFVAASRPRTSLLVTWPEDENRSLLLPPVS